MSRAHKVRPGVWSYRGATLEPGPEGWTWGPGKCVTRTKRDAMQAVDAELEAAEPKSSGKKTARTAMDRTKKLNGRLSKKSLTPV